MDREEIAQALRLDEVHTAEVAARLMRTGFLRDIAAHVRIKITTRDIAWRRMIHRGAQLPCHPDPTFQVVADLAPMPCPEVMMPPLMR